MTLLLYFPFKLVVILEYFQYWCGKQSMSTPEIMRC